MKIVIMEPLDVQDSYLDALASEKLPKDVEIVRYDKRAADAAEMIARGADAEIIVIANQKIPDEAILGWKSMKLLVVAFTGTDHVNVALARDQGAVVCNCAGYSTVAVSELVFGMVIDLLRNVVPCDRVVRQGGTKAGLVGCELAGKTFGVVGTGAIGGRVAKLADAFGCRVIGYSRTEKAELPVEYMSLAEVMAQSDIVSVHLPVTPATRGIISGEMIAKMKPAAFLINTARGPVVETQALADALKEGKIAGAAVDVFDTEPPLPQDNPLLSAPNTLLTPHVAFASDEAFEKRAVIVYDNIRAWLDGKPQNEVK